MADIIDGEWELMCFSHPYDGPLYLERYGRTYPPAADSHDGTWGFLFITSNGSYQTVSGSLKDGFEFDANLACIERKDAKFTYLALEQRWLHVR